MLPQKASIHFFHHIGRSGYMLNDNGFSSRSFDAQPPALGDLVIDTLLHRGIVDAEQINSAAALREQMFREGDLQPAWRWLVWSPNVDRDAIYRVAGEIYDYRRIEMSSHLLKSFIRRIQPCFSIHQWRRMGELGVVPVRGNVPHSGSRLWSFAAYDPTSKHVHAIVRQCVGRDYFLYQADREWVANLVTEAMISFIELPPRRRSKLD